MVREGLERRLPPSPSSYPSQSYSTSYDSINTTISMETRQIKRNLQLIIYIKRNNQESIEHRIANHNCSSVPEVLPASRASPPRFQRLNQPPLSHSETPPIITPAHLFISYLTLPHPMRFSISRRRGVSDNRRNLEGNHREGRSRENPDV